jgi:hypothetical protein
MRALVGAGLVLALQGAFVALATPFASAVWAAEPGKPKPGAYCKIPQEGQAAVCLEPAQNNYKEFFHGLSDGALSDEAARRVESDVAAGAGGDRAYEALSTLAYGYYRLARAASAEHGQDPEIVARLERWNALLSAAYAQSGEDAAYRDAVRTAALDVQHRAPPVGLRCTDAAGNVTKCDSTEAVVRAMDEARDKAGVRGRLGGLIDRIFGSSP